MHDIDEDWRDMEYWYRHRHHISRRGWKDYLTLLCVIVALTTLGVVLIGPHV